jgi:hypothetical protein
MSLWRGRTPRQSIRTTHENERRVSSRLQPMCGAHFRGARRARTGRSTREGRRLKSPSITMNLKTDVSRLRATPTEESAETGTRPTGCGAAVERATALLAHSMQASETPISQLSAALVRMAQTLNDIGTPLFGDPDAKPAGANGPEGLQAFREALLGDIAVCIQSLQFHDRLMQQLTQARDLLTGAALPDKVLISGPAEPANEGSIEGSIELF